MHLDFGFNLKFFFVVGTSKLYFNFNNMVWMNHIDWIIQNFPYSKFYFNSISI